jgi:hypothetical protein
VKVWSPESVARLPVERCRSDVSTLPTLIGSSRPSAVVHGRQLRGGLNSITAIAGTYHAFDFAKYAHRYLAEFQFRFNHRFDMKTILHTLLTCLLAAPPSPEHRLRAAEVHS